MAAKFLTILIVTVLVNAVTSNFPTTRLHENTGLDVFELAAKHGYPMEAHEVETEDGYILGVHRIPFGKNNKHLANKPPVLIIHGTMSCSADWINGGPNASLAYMLADLGYDIWLGNARGNAESRKHKFLDPDTDKKAFWNFSWNEIGRFDLPAMIDYILKETGNEQLQYVGHSQGTTVFFVMASTRPEYNAKVKLATLLAPAAELTNTQNPIIRMIAPFEKTLHTFADLIGVREIFRRSEFIHNISKDLCVKGKPSQELCNIVFFLLGGYDREQLDETIITVITSNAPAGVNMKQGIHFVQVINAKEFRNFDFHDEAKNIEVYGTAIPPKYNLSQITAPVALYYGENDWLVSTIDVESISPKLPNVVVSKLVDYKAFAHFDFLWAIDVVELLYNDVIAIMEQFR